MNAGAWATLIGALATGGGALIGLMIHIIRYAYSQGVTHQRLDAIERQQGASNETNALVAALTATVDALKGSVDRLDRAVERIVGGRMSRSKSDPDA